MFRENNDNIGKNTANSKTLEDREKVNVKLITFAAPATGDTNFCKVLEAVAKPHGGFRIWNDFDVVPSIAQLVGYRHAGIPLRLELSKSAKESFERENIRPFGSFLEVVAPHVLFQLGNIVYVFPVIGWNVEYKK